MLKWGKYALILSVLFLTGLNVIAQTSPAPFNLGGGNYTLACWPLSCAAATPVLPAPGTYPPNMYLHVCSADSNPAIGDPTTANFTSHYALGTGNRFNGLGATGIGMVNASKTPATVGAAVLGLNTTGRTNINVSWQSRTLTTGNSYNLRLQYRITTASPWLDVPGPIEYTYTGIIPNLQTLSVNLSTATANAVDNRPNIELRWKFYYVSGFGSTGCLLTLDEINVSSVANTGNNIATGAIVPSSFCVSNSTGATFLIPFTYTPAANFVPGTCTFAAELSNSAGQFIAPTVIGTIASDGTGSQSIVGALPPGLGTGTSYRVRVVSDVPAVNGNDNGTDIVIRLSPFDVTIPAANCQNSASAISWSLPLGCYNEIMVVACAVNPVAGTPTGNGSAYTANAAFGSGTAFGGGFVVYKGGGTNVTVTGLTNFTQYYFKIWVRYGNEWSSGEEVSCTPGGGTLLKRGDFMVLGVNATNGSPCSFPSGADEISFVVFRDIYTGTTIDMTDNGWQRQVANRWGNTEGTVRMTRTGGTINAGTVITIRFDGSGNGTAIKPDANWTFTNLNGTNQFNLNSGGDQFFFMQGGNWIPGTAGAHDAQYTGTVLFGFNTNTSWTDFGLSTQQSGKFPNLDCYTITPVAGSDYIKFRGTYPSSLSPKTQRNWVDSINDASKWVQQASCSAYNTTSPVWTGPDDTLTIVAGGYMRGKWVGQKSTDWWTCDNWEDFVIPDSLTNVWIPPSGVTFNCRLKLDSTHYCRDLTIDGYELNGADTNKRILKIYGNLNLNAGELDFSDNNPNTKDGVIYIRGNWTNFNELAFREGNSQVVFEGTSLQPVNTPVKEAYWQLDVNNPAGLNAGTVIQVLNQLNMYNGLINTGTNEVYVSTNNTAAIAGYGLTRYINGNLRRQVNTVGNYEFPIGTPTNYEQATLNIASLLGVNNIIASFKSPSPGAAPNSSLCFINASPITGMLNAGNWTINPNVTPTFTNITMTLRERGHSNSVVPASRYGIIRRDDELNDWFGSPLGTHANGTQSEVAGTVTAIRSVINTNNFWGDFAIGFGSAPLPVEWLSFTATPENKVVYLRWSTATEHNNDYFVIERSNDGRTFEAIGQMPGSGTSSIIQSYQFIDIHPLDGTSYYRIRQVDFDGQFDFSKIVPVRTGDAVSGISIYPNPVQDQAWLVMNSDEYKAQLIELYDVAGKLVYSEIVELQAGPNGFSIDMRSFEKGAYLLKVGEKTVRLMK